MTGPHARTDYQPATSSELETALKRYTVFLKTSHKSLTTQNRYAGYIKKLLIWLGERGIVAFKPIKRGVLDDWVADLSQGRSLATMKPIIASARSFFRWSQEDGVELISRKKLRKLLRALALPKVPKSVQRTLSIDEVELLLNTCNLITTKGTRDAAIISALVDTGLRASELCRLKVADISFDTTLAPGVRVNQVAVVVKGGSTEHGYFGQRAARHLQRWLQVRQGVVAAGVEEVFVSLVRSNPGRSIDRHGLKTILRNVGGEAGVSGVSPHTFRRAFAVILEMAGASTKVAKDLGRWKSVEMVLHYQRSYQAALQYNDVSPLDFISRQSTD